MQFRQLPINIQILLLILNLTISCSQTQQPTYSLQPQQSIYSSQPQQPTNHTFNQSYQIVYQNITIYFDQPWSCNPYIKEQVGFQFSPGNFTTIVRRLSLTENYQHYIGFKITSQSQYILIIISIVLITLYFYRKVIIKDFYVVYGCEQYALNDNNESYHDVCIIVNIEPLNVDQQQIFQLDYQYQAVSLLKSKSKYLLNHNITYFSYQIDNTKRDIQINNVQLNLFFKSQQQKQSDHQTLDYKFDQISPSNYWMENDSNQQGVVWKVGSIDKGQKQIFKLQFKNYQGQCGQYTKQQSNNELLQYQHKVNYWNIELAWIMFMMFGFTVIMVLVKVERDTYILSRTTKY